MGRPVNTGLTVPKQQTQPDVLSKAIILWVGSITMESTQIELRAKHITSNKQAFSGGRELVEGKSDKHSFLIS